MANNEQNFESLFDRCIALGWTRTETGNNVGVRSPLGTYIGYSKKKEIFTSGVYTDKDFIKLVHKVMMAYGESAHSHRVKISTLKQSVKELRAVLDSAVECESTKVDKWETSDDGTIHLDYDIGPLSVSATVFPDFSWCVSLEDGGPCDKSTEGTATNFQDARFQVFETLLNWAQEVTDSGRYALHMVTKLRTLLE